MDQAGNRRTNRWESRLDVWLSDRVNSIAIVVVSLGFLARIRAASGTFLNADEAQHFLVANRPTLEAAYKSSFTLAHPPLLVIALYFWRVFGSSEFALRTLSVISGISFCLIFCKWVTRVLGERVALVSLIFVCFLPPLVSLSAQVRQYSLLLFFAGLTLYLFEKSVDKSSPALMLLCSASLYLAMLSHYSALLFAAAIGAYAIVRFTTHRPSRAVLASWLLGQFGALALFTFLYHTHISKLKGGSMAAEATGGWLHRSYFHPGYDRLFLFIAGRTFAVCQFIFGQLVIGDLMGLGFFAALVLLSRSKSLNTGPSRSLPTGRQLALLLAIPFVLNCAAAIVGSYPYGGSRHSVFLAIFAVSGVSFFLVTLSGKKFVRSVAVAIILVSICALFGKPHEPNMPRADQNRAHMERALTFVRQEIPVSNPLFVDVQTRLLLNYYLCPNQQGLAEPPPKDFDVQTCGGYRLITANLWLFTPENFQSMWNQMTQKYNLKPTEPVWVIQEGWSVGVGLKLKATVPEYKDLKAESFGRNIQMFELRVADPESFSIPARATSFRPD